ncbi:MAG: ABC transporter ATP-binding protein [Rhodospirillaceae bacterium]|nr:ABC transporter ATP-binding protein [Rhodospirillaceae bacterium]MYF06550.1 ABC transporter ATP-binding protein [Rhodospirillaceae bacterium]MYH36654.1 ABC transporter ATP-binding protein [Rhodospirillaceae bacterium]MYK13440.1 ABC transporter ATP-binding protein [Rhodospirillaceae bacterium]
MIEVRSLAVSYGNIRAVLGIDLDVAAGEIVALIGANGAGKSSTLRAISGIEKPAGGTIRFEGRDIAGRPPHEIIAAGITQVPEGRQIFGRLSVRENLRLGAYLRSADEIDAAIADVAALFPILQDRLEAPGSELSGGQAQMLALARGVIARPRLLMLDEPTLGLAPKTAGEIFAIIRRLRADGLTIMLVEQNLRQALKIADRAYVLESGRIVLQGTAAELAADRRLHDAYLGVSREDLS